MKPRRIWRPLPRSPRGLKTVLVAVWFALLYAVFVIQMAARL